MSSVVCSLSALAASGVSWPLLVGGHAGVQERLGGGDVAGALGQREARVLELADGLAKGLALLHVFQRGIERALGAVHRLHADDEALARQLAHHLHEALAFHAAQQRICRHAHVVEEQLGGVARVLADFFEVLAAREAGRGRVHQEQAHALGASGRVGLGGQHQQVAVLAVADEDLAAVDDVVVAVAVTYPSRVVRMALRSLPAPGSVMPMAAIASPLAMRGSQCARCASVPQCSR
jgi:hypothetical protein